MSVTKVTVNGLDTSSDMVISGSTPTLTIGDAGAEDTSIVFDGNAKDFYVGLDDTADKLVIGEGSTVGTNSIITVTDDAVTIGDGAAVDTKIVFDGNAQDYYVGLDDTDDDFKIGLGSAVGTTAHIVMDETGAVTKPLQPAFSAYNSGTDSNETGDGSEVNIDYNTEVFDTNSDFASDTFTAPVTGRYFLQCQVGFQQTEDATNTRYRVLIRTSNRDYIIHEQRVQRQNDGGQNVVLLNGSVVADMDASDTAIVRGAVYGGSAVVDIWGNSQPETFFSGCLLA